MGQKYANSRPQVAPLSSPLPIEVHSSYQQLHNSYLVALAQLVCVTVVVGAEDDLVVFYVAEFLKEGLGVFREVLAVGNTHVSEKDLGPKVMRCSLSARINTPTPSRAIRGYRGWASSCGLWAIECCGL